MAHSLPLAPTRAHVLAVGSGRNVLRWVPYTSCTQELCIDRQYTLGALVSALSAVACDGVAHASVPIGSTVCK